MPPMLPDWLNHSIAMRPSERTVLVQQVLAPRVQSYVEWGSGGSTELVAWMMVSGMTPKEFRAFSIESSVEWMARMRKRSKFIRLAESQGRLRFLHGDIGPTAHLGYPVNFDPGLQPTRALPYVDLQRHRHGMGSIDLALVDGRFRLACMLEAITCLTPRSGRVLLHDYSLNDPATRSRSQSYKRALEFYRVVDHQETLATLRPRASINESLRQMVASAALREAI